MPSLSLDDSRRRAELLSVTSYDVQLDLAGDDKTFTSTTTVRFTAHARGETFVDVKPKQLLSAHLDGAPVDVGSLTDGRLPLHGVGGQHELVVAAVMGYRHDGEGLHRAVDPADGRHYTYAMSFLDAAPCIFACFDQPDLKAPYTFHVTAPTDWVVVGNGRAEQVAPGQWELATTPPLSTYFVTLVAGPYHVVTAEH
ncbi:MAG TPA: aminopeptidase N, partial [Nocardioidaceae bacterium]|nr:aminopeptidase N [Nocardioidaceae bacterium]